MAFRSWKQKTFGLGGDPRLGLLLQIERDNLRKQIYEPQIKRRKNLKFLKKIVAARKHLIADEVRNSLSRFYQSPELSPR